MLLLSGVWHHRAQLELRPLRGDRGRGRIRQTEETAGCVTGMLDTHGILVNDYEWGN